MFSPDEFYFYLKLRFVSDRLGSSIWAGCEHGSKNLGTWGPLDPLPERDQYSIAHLPHLTTNGIIILHDQEVFTKDLLDTYRESFYDHKKITVSRDLTKEQIIMAAWTSVSWPIWCHSQKASKDIDWLESLGLIPCHYFYHGFIARDWYKFYKYHPQLNWNPNAPYRFLLYARDCSGTRSYRRKVIDGLLPVPSLLYHAKPIDSDCSAKIDLEDQKASLIQIVCETVFDEPKCTHLTEKFLKSIVMYQPFIGISGAGSLRYLRSYGFRTFHEVWDESYDGIEDADERLRHVFQLIDRLAALDKISWQNLVKRCQPIVEHNRKHFFSDFFETRLLSELGMEMNDALAKQKQQSQTDPGGAYFKVIDQVLNDNTVLDVFTTEKIHKIAQYLRTTQPERWIAICQQYSWALAY